MDRCQLVVRIPRLKSSRYPHAKAAVNEGDPFLALVAHPQPLSVEKKQAPTSEPSEEDNGFLSALLVASGVDVRTSIRATAALRGIGDELRRSFRALSEDGGVSWQRDAAPVEPADRQQLKGVHERADEAGQEGG